MENIIKSCLLNLEVELQLKGAIYLTVQEMIGKVEKHSLVNEYYRMEHNFQSAQRLNDSLLAYLKKLEERCSSLSVNFSKMQSSAVLVRDSLVAEIGHFLTEAKQNKVRVEKVALLEDRLAKLSKLGGSAEEEEEEGDEVAAEDSAEEGQQSGEKAQEESVVGERDIAVDKRDEPPVSAVSAVASEQQAAGGLESTAPNNFFMGLEDDLLLQTFSYLETLEVLNTAQICRVVYRRIDGLFGTESALVKKWEQPPAPAPPTEAKQEMEKVKVELSDNEVEKESEKAKSSPFSLTVPPSSGLGEVRWSKDILDSFTRKLNAQELKLVLEVTDKLKKQVLSSEALKVENEDLQARLQSAESIRDFLVEKLKGAEKALKTLMGENSTLKKQSGNDQEIISYLDLQVQELDGQTQELGHRCQQLQTSLDLQQGMHSHREEQLQGELSQLKERHEKLDTAFKSQKKLLVKEVKTLRGQVDSLNQERSLYLGKLQLLREAFDCPQAKQK